MPMTHKQHKADTVISCHYATEADILIGCHIVTLSHAKSQSVGVVCSHNNLPPFKDGVPTDLVRDSLPGKVDLNTGTICVNLNLKFSSIQSLIDADSLSCKISSQK